MKTINLPNGQFLNVHHVDNIDDSHINRKRFDTNSVSRFEYQAHYQNIDNTRKLKAIIREDQYVIVPSL